MNLTHIAKQIKSKFLAKQIKGKFLAGDLTGAAELAGKLANLINTSEAIKIAAVANIMAGKPKEALPYLDKLNFAASLRADELLIMARCYKDLNHLTEAREYALKAINISPDDDSARVALAEIESLLGG